MGSAAQHDVLQHFCQNFSLCLAGRHPTRLLPPYAGHSSVVGEPLCCIPHAGSGQSLDSHGFPLENIEIQLGAHEACLAGKIMTGFCYLCGFVFS